MNHRLHLDIAPRGHFLKMGTISPKERVPHPKMKPWTFHTVCHFVHLYAVFRCVCVGITDCCLLLLLSAL